MRVKREGIRRRAVIETYGEYDCTKHNRPIPDFGSWDWSNADAIDDRMKDAGLKVGVPAGYLLWNEVEFSIQDLCECAVLDRIFPGEPRALGLVSQNKLVGWEPDRRTLWFEPIKEGRTPNIALPMLFRPAVKCEHPAQWYVEDGSGRAVALVSRRHLFDEHQSAVSGFLGAAPDRGSTFMRSKLAELLH